MSFTTSQYHYALALSSWQTPTHTNNIKFCLRGSGFDFVKSNLFDFKSAVILKPVS